jgi:cell division protein FtsQ
MRPVIITADDRIVPPKRRARKAAKATRTKAKPAAAKRKAAKRTARRKPLPTWFRPAALAAAIALIAVSLAGTGVWLWRTGVVDAAVARVNQTVDRTFAGLGLTVREVTVAGRERTEIADILRAVDVKRGDIILAVDLDAARERLEALGWVRRAMVARRFPDTLHIKLEERKPFALWQYNGAIHLVDREGAPITGKNLARYRDLIYVVGESAGERAAALFGVLRTEPELMKRVKTVSLIRGRRWDVIFANGVKVRLPEEQVAAAWRKLATVEREHAILRRDLVAIDMRIADRLVVRLSPQAAERRRLPGKST